MYLANRYKIIPVMNTANYNDGVDGDSINMAQGHRWTFVLTFGAITGNAVLTVNSGATAGAKTSPLTFKYALGSATIGSATADVLGAQATSAALTLTGTTYANKMLVVEINGSAMDTVNEEEWLTIAISDAADAGICHIVAIVEPRYSDNITYL